MRLSTVTKKRASFAGGALLAAASVASVACLAYRARRKSLRGSVVVITGGSRGLGLALAKQFGKSGANLVLAARDSGELDRAKDLLVRDVSLAPEQILTVTADLRNPQDADTLIARANEVFGRIDVLINNAGVITVGPVEQQTIDTFHEVMNTNLFSAVRCSLAVLPGMLGRQSGTIVNIASIGGKVAVPHLLPYTTSKFAIVGFSQGLHSELRSKGVHVLTVCPGLMRTGSHLNALFSGDAPREYRWFSLLASLPGVSVSARHAAKRILQAVQRKETEISISPQAALASRLAPIVPELVTMAMSMTNSLLPDSEEGSTEVRKGNEVRDSELFPTATLGWKAAQRYNQTS